MKGLRAGREWFAAVPRSLALAARLATSRFPVAAALIVAFALASNLRVAEVDLWPLGRWPRLLSALGGAAAVSVALRVGAEALGARPALLSLLPLTGATAIGLTIWFGDPLTLYAPALIAVSVLAVPLAPFLRRGSAIQFWSFTLWSFVGVVLAFLSVLLFCLGLHAILEMVRFLFRAGVDWRAYAHIWTTALTLVGPLFALARIPPTEGRELDLRAEDALVRAVRSLLEWVATPLALATALVLHVYGLRILLTGEVPLEEVGWIVTFFAVLVLSLRIGLDPFLASGAFPTRIFARTWAGALCFPLAILVYAAALRIDAQGVTISRYFLVVAALSGALVVLVQAVPRARGDIRIMAAIPVALLALTVAGPWSAANVVGRSQVGFIETSALDDAGRLDLDRLDPAFRRSLRSRVRELAEVDQLWRLEAYIPPQREEALRLARAPDGRANRQAMLAALGLQQVAGSDPPIATRGFSAVATDPLDLMGYDVAFTSRTVELTPSTVDELVLRFEGRDLVIERGRNAERADLGGVLDAIPAGWFDPSVRDLPEAPVFDLLTRSDRPLRVRIESLSLDPLGQPVFATLTLLARRADWPEASGGF